MKNVVFKKASVVLVMVVLISLIFLAISQFSVYAETGPGYVFQEDFGNPSNNGFAWGTSDIVLSGSEASATNGWWDNNDSGKSTYKPSGVIRVNSGGANDTEFYHKFMSGTNGDITIAGTLKRSIASNRYGSVYVYNDTTVVAKLYIPASSGACSYLSGTTLTAFTANGNAGVNTPFKIVLKWDVVAGTYTSAEYYINGNTTAATTTGDSLANKVQTTVNKFGCGEDRNTYDADWDDFTVYAGAGVTLPSATVPTISGMQKEGQLLTATYIYGADSSFPEINSIFQWKQSDTVDGEYTDIAGATASTFRITAAQVGKFIKYSVIPKDNAGNSGTIVLSSATGIIEVAANRPVVTNVGISGTPRTGVVLTGTYTYSGDPEGTSLFQWQVADTQGGTYTDIAGATAVTFIPTSAQTTKYLKFIVTPTDINNIIGIAQVSDASSVVTGTLATPNAPSRSGKVFSWVRIPSALTYTVVLSKTGVGVINTYTDVSENSQDCGSDINANGAGTYTVTVQAIGDGTIYTDSAVSSAGSVTVYSITYHENTGTGAVPIESTYTQGSNYTVKGNIGDPALTRNGYSFSGWATAAGTDGAGSGTFRAVGTKIAMGTSNVNLYATWAPNTLTVTYNANGGVGTQIDSNLYAANVSEVYVQGDEGITREGYILTGWAEAGTGIIHDRYSKFIIGSSNVMLLAQWELTASLSNLTLSAGELSPTFTSNIVDYTSSVPNDTATLTITPTGSDVGIYITVNDIDVLSGTASENIDLNVGENIITIVATAQNYTLKIYTVTVTRMPATIDKTVLQFAIANATTLINSTPVGTEGGNVPQVAYDAFQAAIDTASAVNVNVDATQEDVDAQVTALSDATTEFNKAIISEIVKYHITGTVSLLNGADLTKVSIVVKQAGVTVDTVSVLADGTFTISLLPGTYTFEIFRSGYLTKKFTDFTVTTEEVQSLLATTINLIAGDVVVTAQNTIDLQDLQRVLSNFGLTSSDLAFNFVYDLNDDGAINLIDLQAVLKNFGSVQN